ncbi:MAG: lipoate--protein ligase [Nanoarchaeota archaeon]
MSKARCLISETNDPFFNLATEDFIFKDMSTDENILFLWRNNPSIIIGRNQNPWAECDLKKIEQNNINLVRRQSGGGAVFQDLGNTNFTFLSSRKDYDRKRNFDIIINALERFGIKAIQSGRNDILVGGKKISGSAFKENPDRAFHHGTLLINVNLDKLAEYLTPSPKKLLAKGTTSVRSRVANITEFNSELNHESLTQAIIDEFFKTYNSEKNMEILNHNSLKEIPELNNYYQLLKSNDWRFGETPQFQHQLTERFDWATVDLHLDTDAGRIKKAKLFSDCLNIQLIEEIEKSIQNIDYHPESITNKIEQLKQQLPDSINQIKDFQDWISRELA